MPTKNDKSKTTNQENTKKTGNKSSKSEGADVANSVPSSKASDKAKGMDSKRRGDTETFNL